MKTYQIEMRSYTSLETLSQRITDPDWSTVEHRVRRVYELGGNVTFNISLITETDEDEDFFDDEEEKAPAEPKTEYVAECSMRTDPGRFLLSVMIYGVEEGTGKDRVMSWQDPEGTPPRGMIDIAGDDWDARWIQTDISIALRVFKELLDAGELSAESMQHMR